MIENWAAEKLGAGIGDTVSFAFADKAERPFVISGIFADYGGTKATGEPGRGSFHGSSRKGERVKRPASS
jgi:hypothetical protein